MVDAWLKDHDPTLALPVAFLPPIGIIVERDGEPVASGHLYETKHVNIFMPDWLASKPGLSLAEAKEAFRVLDGYFEKVAEEPVAPGVASLVWGRGTPVMARAARSLGYFRGGNQESVLKAITWKEEMDD